MIYEFTWTYHNAKSRRRYKFFSPCFRVSFVAAVSFAETSTEATEQEEDYDYTLFTNHKVYERVITSVDG